MLGPTSISNLCLRSYLALKTLYSLQSCFQSFLLSIPVQNLDPRSNLALKPLFSLLSCSQNHLFAPILLSKLCSPSYPGLKSGSSLKSCSQTSIFALPRYRTSLLAPSVYVYKFRLSLSSVNL